MKKPVTIKISVTIYTDKEPELVKGAVRKGILKELDNSRLAIPVNVKIETSIEP